MRRFLLRRISFGIVAILGATVIVFVLSRVGGQDPRYFYLGDTGGAYVTQEQWDAWGEKLGLNHPLVVQYFLWLGNILQGDFGHSISAQQPVLKRIKERTGMTLQLGLGAWIFGTALGVPLGVFSAIRRGGALDYVARIFALIGQSTPIFWVGIMGILVFSVYLGWFPSGTRGTGMAIRNLVLPSMILGLNPAASYLRLTRSSMLEVLDSEFVLFARAKGVSSRAVLWKHAFKNASLVPLTVSALVLVGFMTGVVVIETVFALPGLGRLAVDSIWDNDFPTLTALVLFFAAIYVGMMLVLDLLYALLDPRIRYE